MDYITKTSYTEKMITYLNLVILRTNKYYLYWQ